MSKNPVENQRKKTEGTQFTEGGSSHTMAGLCR